MYACTPLAPTPSPSAEHEREVGNSRGTIGPVPLGRVRTQLTKRCPPLCDSGLFSLHHTLLNTHEMSSAAGAAATDNAAQPRVPLTLPESFMIGGLAGCAAVSVSECLSVGVGWGWCPAVRQRGREGRERGRDRRWERKGVKRGDGGWTNAPAQFEPQIKSASTLVTLSD